MPDYDCHCYRPCGLKHTEEWSIESIAGGITGTREDVEAWREAWLEEYGDTYQIHTMRRYVSSWEERPLD